MDFNKIPWTSAELGDYASLVVAALMVAAFPVVYSLLADLRDGLARVILFATSATAAAFLLTAILWPLEHAGYSLPVDFGHWLARVVYLTVGLGKLLLTLALIRDLRTRRGKTWQSDRSNRQEGESNNG